jgi:hypothetical protein
MSEADPKPPHLQRMETELAELRDRIEKLTNFAQAKNLTFTDLPETDRLLLVTQCRAMTAYLGILEIRVLRANR